MIPFKCDLQVDNFVRFFENELSGMTANQREKIPFELMDKLFRRNGELTTHRLTFLQQLYVLTKALDEEVYILIKRNDNDLSFEDFEKYQKNKKKKEITIDEANYYLGKGVFVLSGRELMDWMSHLNNLSLSSAYNYGLRLKKTREPNLPIHEKEFRYFANLLSYYEGNKRKIIKYRQLQMPEWYILLYLCDGKSKGATAVYDEIYKDAINSSRKTILDAFKKLISRKYIQKFNKGKNTVYEITMAGKEEVKQIIRKYILT